MHARLTRYEGGAVETIDENLQAKKGVLPTEFGQTEGMKGAVFLVDRERGTVVVISLWQDENALEASEDEATRVRQQVTGAWGDGFGRALRGGAPQRRASGPGRLTVTRREPLP